MSDVVKIITSEVKEVVEAKDLGYISVFKLDDDVVLLPEDRYNPCEMRLQVKVFKENVDIPYNEPMLEDSMKYYRDIGYDVTEDNSRSITMTRVNRVAVDDTIRSYTQRCVEEAVSDSNYELGKKNRELYTIKGDVETLTSRIESFNNLSTFSKIIKCLRGELV